MTTALIACGALAREVLAIRDRHGWDAEVLGVPSLLHMHPGRIPTAVRDRITEAKTAYDRVVVVYGDCGTGGRLDQVLEAEGVERIAGPHCFEMYANGRPGTFEALLDEELGTFFLTDYLVQSFDHLVIEELGLDRFPSCARNTLATTPGPSIWPRPRTPSCWRGPVGRPSIWACRSSRGRPAMAHWSHVWQR